MNRFRCGVCGKEDVPVFNCNYCGGCFCTEHHLPENHNCPNKPPPKNEATTNSEDSICIECKTKLNDDTLKNVTKCPYCQRPMCNYHLRPKPIFIPDFKDTGKRYKEVQEIIEKDLHADDGHPCLPYTKIFWKEYEKRQERYKKQLEQLVHKPLFTLKREKSVQLERAKNAMFQEKLNKPKKVKKKIRKLITNILFAIVFFVMLYFILNLFSNPDFARFHLNKAFSSLQLAFGSGWIIVFYYIPIPIPLSTHSAIMAGIYFGSIIFLLICTGLAGKKGALIGILILLTAALMYGEPERLSTKDFDTMQQLRSFLQTDKTDQLEYTSNFKCIDFSLTLISHAKDAGYRIYFTSSSNHAYCKAYIVSENTWVYIEPQTDEVWK